MKILIAHDWPIFRAGIIQILRSEFGQLEITQAPTAPESLDLASGPWDLAFVDAREGHDLVTALKRAHPRQRVLWVSSCAEDCHFDGALKERMRASITIGSTREEVVTAARRAVTGIEARVVSTTALLSKTPQLSGREMEVLRLLAVGKNVKEVAAALDVSASTISTHRVRLLGKLQLRSTGELIRYALKNNLGD